MVDLIGLNQPNCRNITISLKFPRLGKQSVSDTWSLAKIVRKVEVKLLHFILNEVRTNIKKVRTNIVPYDTVGLICRV